MVELSKDLDGGYDQTENTAFKCKATLQEKRSTKTKEEGQEKEVMGRSHFKCQAQLVDNGLEPQLPSAVDTHKTKDATLVIDMTILALDLRHAKSLWKRPLMHLNYCNTLY